MARIYEATWDETYVNPGTRMLSEKHFNSDNGYDADDLRVSTLSQLESWLNSTVIISL
ncbi:hypothetical protein [Caballeronia sp. dw_19]|uniref:hypothetical protein n=1 Tax=Caballeronia sp. dw_19 TaxID=2719791 RepID=UPI001BD30696|nr:hypothetical protein [Caballeronia sp. dw_19]